MDEKSSGSSKNIFYFLAPIAAAAAIAIALVFPNSDGNYDKTQVYSAVAPFADFHGDCLKKVVDFKFESSDPQVLDSCMSELEQLLPKSLYEYESEDISIAAATISELPDGKEPLLEYVAFGDSVSLFVNHNNSIDKSPFRKEVVDGRDMFVGSCTTYRYVIWECGGFECVAVSRLDEGKILQFASAF